MTSAIQVVRQSGITVVYCPARIVAGSTEELLAAAKSEIEHAARVVLHLRSVTHIDSTGLGLLAWLCVSARRRSGDVKLVAPSAHIKHLLEITMIGRMFTVHPTVESAIAAFSPAVQAEPERQ